MDKKDIFYADKENIVVVKPPECRLLQMGAHYFLSLPHIVYIVRRCNSTTYICVAFSQKPVKSIDDQLYGLPLPNIHYNGFVCGINSQVCKKPEQTAEKMIDLFWNSIWRCCRGYHWMDQYGATLQFHNRLKELMGQEVPKRKVNMWGGYDDDPYGAPACDTEMYKNWQTLSKEKPEFIMEMPLIAHSDAYRNVTEIIKRGMY